MSALAADAAARDRACREYVNPLVVVAGAGTGKTTTLVARVVTWLVGPGWTECTAPKSKDASIAARAVDAVLAITFTKAAAAEMDARVRSSLRELEQGVRPIGVVLPNDAVEVGAETRDRARLLRLALDHALATTIHGFCQSLLAEHPTEARLAPGFTVDADAEFVPQFAQQAVEEDLAAAFAGGSRDEDWLRLARDGVGPDVVAACAARLRGEGARAADLERDPTSHVRLAEHLGDLAERVNAFTRIALAPLRTVTGAAQVERALNELSRIADILGARHSTEPADTCRAIVACACRDLGVSLKKWSEGDFGKKGEAALGENVDAATRAALELRPPLTSALTFDVDAFRARRTLVRRVLARAEQLGADAGVLTYGDLLTRAAQLVEDDAPLRQRLRRRYRQVLVDEFQDTDSVQCRLVRAIALGPKAGRPGLFLVGDPKQSIYGWRGADLRAYDDFVDEVLAAGGTRLELVKNFRSTPQILDVVQRFVQPTMVEEHGVQPPFQVLHPRDATPGARPEVWVTWQTDPAADKSFAKTKVDDAARYEVAQLIRALREEHERKTPWKDMAVLLRSRTRLDVALDALRAAGIPFQVEGDRSYYQRREIVDACALFGAIVDAGDTVSLLACLRSVVCGLPDAALEHLWTDVLATEAQLLGSDPTADAQAIERVAVAARDRAAQLKAQGWPDGRGLPDFVPALTHMLESIAVLRRSLRDDPADRFVEKLRELVLLEPTESARYQGRYRAANLERFLRRLGDELEATGDAAAVLRGLRRSLDEERESKEARPRGEVEDAVRFLTIHAAKGLEFECVFLTGMAAGSNRGGKSGDGIDAATGEQRLCGAPSPGWWRSETAARAREGAERVRLLYVALTRARRRLVLSGVWREAREMRTAARAQSFRDLVEHGLPADFGDRVRARIGGPPDAFECDGLDTRLVHTDPEPSAPNTAPARDPRSAANARRDHARLSELGPAALARAARTRLGTASSTPSDPDSQEPITAPAHGAELVNRAQLTREEARLVGTLLHAALELAPDFAAARARMDALAARVGASPRVLADARGVLTDTASGPLAARFTRIAVSIVARELPIVLAASGNLGPTEAWTGSADLVYRDGDAWVVVDFKTESLAGVDAGAASAAHAHQLEVYAEAVRRALDLHVPVRREVWFLRDGVVGVLT